MAKTDINKSDKKRALEAFLASNEKKYGEEGVKFGEAIKSGKVIAISTGSILLDDALGCGGLPRGRAVEIYGEEGSGKTSLVTKVCAIAQNLYEDEFIGWIDVENALNLAYAEMLGLDRSRMAFSQPSSGEQALDQMLGMCESGAFSVVVLDSVGGLSTKRQLEKEMDEHTIGEVARLLSNNVKRICDAAAKTNTLVIFINQLRTNIAAYGAPAQTMGGKALRFFASQRIQVKKKDVLVNKDKEPIGQEQIYIMKKNRMGTPFLEVETEFYFGKGFNPFKELIDICLAKGIIVKGGAWYYPLPHDRNVKFQGKDKLIEWYTENALEFDALEIRYREFISQDLTSEVEQTAENI